jgi:hypothetical protein
MDMACLQKRKYFPIRIRWRTSLVFLACIASFTLGFLWYIGLLNDNLRIVTPGKFFRSGQMDEESLYQTVQTYRIATIINLRGSNKGAWYPAERKAARESHAQHLNIELDATELPAPKALANLLQVFHTGPYPILVHCKAGADRAGLASTIYRMVIEKMSLDAAMSDQLTWHYGHFPFGQARAMSDFFELYRQTGKDRGKSLEQWILQDYPALYAAHLAARKSTRSSYEGGMFPSLKTIAVKRKTSVLGSVQASAGRPALWEQQ